MIVALFVAINSDAASAKVPYFLLMSAVSICIIKLKPYDPPLYLLKMASDLQVSQGQDLATV